MNYDFRLVDRFGFSLERVGQEKEPVMSVERVLAEPDKLVEYAATEVCFTPAWSEHGGYPGIRAPAPLNYVNSLVRALDPYIRRAFDLRDVKLARAECNLSLVNRPPDALKPLQRIPHVDTADPLQFAILHYLCSEVHGGTAFYRHRATGFETLTPERVRLFERIRDHELANLEDPPSYIIGHSQHYEQTRAFDAAFDRVLIYRSRAFHSGMIPSSSAFSSDPRKGRLTANIFLNYVRS